MKKTRKKQTKIFNKFDSEGSHKWNGREFIGRERRLQRMIQIRKDRIETNQSEIEEYTKEEKTQPNVVFIIIDSLL